MKEYTWRPNNISSHLSNLGQWGIEGRVLTNGRQRITINASGPYQARVLNQNPYTGKVLFEANDCLEFCYCLNSGEFVVEEDGWAYCPVCGGLQAYESRLRAYGLVNVCMACGSEVVGS